MRRKKSSIYPGAYVAFTLMVVSFIGMALPEWIISRDWGAIGQPSALQLTLEPIYFGGVMLMFPFAACTVFAPLQVEEIQSGFIWERVVRTSMLKYGFRQIFQNFTCSMACFTAAFLAHALLFHLIALPSMPEVYEAHEIPYAPDCIYAEWISVCHGLPIILWVALMIGFSAGVWATLGLAIAPWIPDRLLAISIPTFIYYIVSSQSFFRFTGNQLPHPADLYNDALTADMAVRSLGYNLVLFLLFAGIYLLGIRRRLQR